LIAANVIFGETNGRGADLTELAAAVNGATGKTGISASLSVDKATMTLLSDDGYDVVAENYALVGVTGPNMIVAGADEKHAALSGVEKLSVQAGIEPNSVQVSGEVTFRSPFIFSVASGNVGTSAAPNLMSPLAPFESTSPAFDVTPGTYIVNTGTAKASSTYGGTTPSPTAAGTTGTGMTVQVTVADVAGVATVTGAQILNPGSNYQFHNVVEINGSDFETGGTGSVQLVFNPPSTSGLSNDTAIVNSGGMFSSNPPGATLSSVSQLDVLTVANAKKMLTAVDGALVRIDLERSDLGATMSRMEHVINNLSNISKNTKEARSRIQDADIALETTNLTKAQVLNQAAQAMLAQANRTSQSILSLLQN
jgi:flagellin